MRIRYGGTNFVRTDVSATNCTSGRKCLYRLDVIVCDVSYMTGVGRRCYSVIICMVHTISFISISFNRFAGVVVIVVVRTFVSFLPLIYYYQRIDSSLLGG